MKVEVAFEEEKAQWRVEEAEHRRVHEKAEVDATNARSVHESTVAAITSDAEQRLKVVKEAKKVEVAEYMQRIDQLTERVEELIRAKKKWRRRGRRRWQRRRIWS